MCVCVCNSTMEYPDDGMPGEESQPRSVRRQLRAKCQQIPYFSHIHLNRTLQKLQNHSWAWKLSLLFRGILWPLCSIIYIYIYISAFGVKYTDIYLHTSSSSSSRAASTDYTNSLYPSLSSIAPSRSSKLHLVSEQTRCRWVLVGRPILACPCTGVHWRTSFKVSSLLLQHSPESLVRLYIYIYI